MLGPLNTFLVLSKAVLFISRLAVWSVLLPVWPAWSAMLYWVIMLIRLCRNLSSNLMEISALVCLTWFVSISINSLYFSCLHHPVHCVHHLCLLHHHRLPPHPWCKDCKQSKYFRRHFRFILQGRPGFLTPWLVLTTISMVFQVLNVLAGLIALEWGKTFSTIIGLVIEAYLFVCVWSLRYEGDKLRDFYFERFLLQEAAARGQCCHT